MYIKLMQWLGSKFRLLPQFLAMVMDCEEYYELFIGAGSVFLNKQGSKVEVINDKDFGIATLWKVLGIEELAEKFYEKFMEMDVNKATFDYLVKQSVMSFPNMSDVDIAVAVYYITQFAFDGNRKNMRYAGDPEEWSAMEEAVKNELAYNWRDIKLRAQGATVLNADALEILELIKYRKNALILLDPPYVPELLGENKNLYDVKFTVEEQVRMLESVQNIEAKIIICGYRGASYLYDRYLNTDTGWRCYLVDDRLTKACKTGDIKGFAEEYVWTNFEIPTNARFVMDVTDWALSQKEADMLYGAWKRGTQVS